MIPSETQRLAPRERPAGSPVMFQRWADLLFLHWEVPAEWLRPTLPAGLHLDTYEDRAFLAVVPFSMEKVRPRFLPCVPGLSWFLELNLRTYVYDEQGRPGVWFYSLDANQALAVELARKLFHLPYQHAKMSLARKDAGISFASQRKRDPAVGQFCYQGIGPTREAQVGSLEFFFLERYLLFSTDRQGTLKIGQVHHRPYPFQEAHCEPLSTRLFPLNQFPEPAQPPLSTLYSAGVEVEIFSLRNAAKSTSE